MSKVDREAAAEEGLVQIQNKKLMMKYRISWISCWKARKRKSKRDNTDLLIKTFVIAENINTEVIIINFEKSNAAVEEVEEDIVAKETDNSLQEKLVEILTTKEKRLLDTETRGKILYVER